jgi:hypothetical protein
MVIEDGRPPEHRQENLLAYTLLQLTGGLRRRAARAIIGAGRS